MRTILFIVLALMLLGSFPVWPYSANWGFYPGISIGTILMIAVIVALMSNKRLT